MPLDMYRLNCPRCGQVEGAAESEVEQADLTAADADDLIQEETFDSASGRVTRYRCPRCGTWVHADRVEPV